MAGRNGQNQRNYYRVLYVQPDAPAAIIQAAYRTLMHEYMPYADNGQMNARLLDYKYD